MKQLKVRNFKEGQFPKYCKTISHIYVQSWRKNTSNICLTQQKLEVDKKCEQSNDVLQDFLS